MYILFFTYDPKNEAIPMVIVIQKGREFVFYPA